jgi:L-Ala-D/L-Glu epimerase
MELFFRPLTLRLRNPLRAAYGEVTERELLAVTLRDLDGAEGRGEAAPLAAYDGIALDDVCAELQACRALLRDAGRVDGPAARAELQAATRAACRLGPAAAALDVALWDLLGRRAGRPVSALLGSGAPGRVAVNATLSAEAPAAAGRIATAAVAEGFGCLKVKAGRGDDRARVAAVRAAAGPSAAIRLDANGAWSVDEAEDALAGLARFGLELCEEPVHGVAAFRSLRGRTKVPLAMDETADDPAAAASGAADFVCLKLARCGGITGLLDSAAAAREAGSRVYLASTLDGPVGIAAALHAAAAIRPDAPSGLATLGLFAGLEDPFPPHAGAIAVPAGPGLGAVHPSG